MASEFEKRIRSEEQESSVIQMIKDCRKVTRIIGWPGRPDIKIKMRLLTISESREAKIENQKEFKRDGIDIAYHNIADYREQESVHGMWRVFTDVDTGERLFKSAEQMRLVCTNDELTALCNAYNAFADENDPNVDRLSDEDFETLVDTLKKKPDLIPQKVLSLPMALKLLRILVVPQQN